MRDNQTINAILGRRSIRKFTEERVSGEVRDLLLECAFAAPSAHGRRPCEFIVIEDRQVLNDLAEAHDSGKMLRQAPLAIAVCAQTAGYPEGDRAWVEDCAAAMENILIAARALGLEGVWLKVMDTPGTEDQAHSCRPGPGRDRGHRRPGAGREERKPLMKERT